jgi:hypothetical protein
MLKTIVKEPSSEILKFIEINNKDVPNIKEKKKKKEGKKERKEGKMKANEKMTVKY